MDFAQLSTLFMSYKYLAIFVATVIEGPIIMMMSGVMLKLGIVSILPTYIVLILADLVGDVFWYALGYYFAHPISEKYGHFIGLTSDVLVRVREKFRNHEMKVLFISKITLGFGFALAPLVFAGMSKMSFKKYITALFFGQFIWTGGLLAIGYFFGNLYTKIDKNFRVISIIAFIIVIILIMRGVQSYFKNRNLMNNGKPTI